MVQGKRYAVYALFEPEKRDSKGNPIGKGETIWTRAGSAWVNKDGSMNLVLDVLPLQGRLHVREPTEKRDDRAAGASLQQPNRAVQAGYPQQAASEFAQPGAAYAQQPAEYPQQAQYEEQAQYQSFSDATASMGDH